MTIKRDLKRRVRQRQARTGEAYVTARRHVLAAQPASDVEEPDVSAATATDIDATGAAGGDIREGGEPEPEAGVGNEVGDSPAAKDAPVTAVPVVELVDVSEQARRLGLLCRVTMFPALAQRIDPAIVLKRLRDLLVDTAGDPLTLLLASVALTGNAPRRPPRQSPLNIEQLRRFFVRARAGLGGTSEDGSALAFHVAAGGGIVPILCSLSWSLAWRDASLTLSAIDDLTADPWNQVAALRGPPGSFGRSLMITPRRPEDELEQALLGAMRLSAFGPTLVLIHEGRSYPITRDEFLIGRESATVHLAIEDGMVARHHAAVIRRSGAYYLKDLGSTHGILYKGMRIDNKRIDEGDVFEIGGHQLHFTFEAER